LRPPVNIKIASELPPFKGVGFDYTAFEDPEPSRSVSSNVLPSKKTEDFQELANLG